MSRALVFPNGLAGQAQPFSLSRAAASPLGAEKRLQEILFDHPELIPIEEIDPGAGQVVALCRELVLQRPSGPVFLDMIGVTRRGRLVLVECKLWRNPQARREVIGQILEYAGLLKNLSYGDLSALVASRNKSSSDNVLWQIAAAKLGLEDEAAFVDAVSHSLAQGAFDLVIVGDGIRSEIDVVRSYLEAATGLTSRLALVELRTYVNEDGQTLIVPQVALRTRLVEHRVVVQHQTSVDDLRPARIEPSETLREGRDERRRFWQRYIDEVSFRHPDQPPPSHGGTNWVRLKMPLGYVVAYRESRAKVQYIGLFLRLKGEAGEAAHDALTADLPQIQHESGLALTAGYVAARDAWDIAIDREIAPFEDETAQLDWLKTASDALVLAVRPRLAALGPQEAE